ncbi:Lectin C-type domain protein [Aspergillus homomorphus CBS 101889]|uniref:Maintenance of telomere capping protein 6 n=1 Tax=Aspergillus homomorphus (strain CBS 101889) TaxID=1450537 RepID=A0A395IF32_ASPHC|nr:lectin C-type domain protein [Aspergillus homomorphus CBS 101889]RAL17778.1 lectin C-type domain protein [Aspergillus homomorphus CBS 101889]
MKFDPDIILNATQSAVFLSERDVAGQIPLNFVTTSSVSLRAACFGNNVYDEDAAGRCISNLLTIGYRRLIVDLYWSTDDRKWLLCPVSIPEDATVVSVSGTSTETATATATRAAQATVTAVASSSGSPLYELGSYRCTNKVDLDGLIDVLRGHFQRTASELTAYIRFISFNLHAAASATDPREPAPALTGVQLPSRSETLSSIFDHQLSSYVYTPSELASERANLNESWFEVDDSYKPIKEYFTIEEDAKGIQSTPDGWPCGKFVQLAREKRLLVEYAYIDPAMQEYDVSPADSIIFLPHYLSSTISISIDASGTLDSTCYYVPGASDIAAANSSWAISNYLPVPQAGTRNATLEELSAVAANLTACGLTPSLNDTLFNTTAGESAEPYEQLSLSSSWAWSISQPADASTNSNDDDDDDDGDAFSSNDHCAVMDLSLAGHWRAVNCSARRHAACRVGTGPFTWRLSAEAHTFADAYDHACPADTTLAVPRTGVENTYLYRYLLTQTETLDPTATSERRREVWLDLNSLDVTSCWVTGGPDVSCPYAADPGELERRTVLVAAIAGIVICIIAALTLFVKCNANRRNSRRNKRVIKGWEYEGVPS